MGASGKAVGRKTGPVIQEPSPRNPSAPAQGLVPSPPPPRTVFLLLQPGTSSPALRQGLSTGREARVEAARFAPGRRVMADKIADGKGVARCQAAGSASAYDAATPCLSEPQGGSRIAPPPRPYAQQGRVREGVSE
jgi:hypothetical protein